MEKDAVVISKDATLTKRDIKILEGSANRTVRVDPAEDAEVKRLYSIWKEL